MADFDPNMVQAAQDAYKAARAVKHKEGATLSEKAGDISASVTEAIMPTICRVTGMPKFVEKIAPTVARHCSGFVFLARAYEKYKSKKENKQEAKTAKTNVNPSRKRMPAPGA